MVSSKVPQNSEIRVSFHTVEKEHVQEEQLKCAEGAPTQTAHLVGSDLCGDTQDNGEMCTTQLPLPRPRGGRQQTKCDSEYNDSAM